MEFSYKVQVPDELLEAIRDKRLVLFVGAGVSIDKPTELPDFCGLVKEVCKTADIPYDKNQSLDDNLNRVMREGYNVHADIACKMDLRSDRINNWHKLIGKIFQDDRDVRVVTTNFDEMLSYVFAGRKIKEYIAPAMPLGDDFHGLVYLHGKRTEEDSLVATSEDFAKAYLNKGWATRFLQAMFTEYTVLFLGYSIGDTLVRYLTQGVVGTGSAFRKRFVFDAPSKSQRWKSLGITPILIEGRHGPKNIFRISREILQEISEDVQLDALGQQEKMKSIIKKHYDCSHNLSPREAECMQQYLQIPGQRIYFCRHAQSISWLQWGFSAIIEVKNLLAGKELTDEMEEYITWILQAGFAAMESQHFLLETFSQGKVPKAMWHRLLYCFPDNIQGECLADWVDILLRDAIENDTKPLIFLLQRDFMPQMLRWRIFCFLFQPKNTYTMIPDTSDNGKEKMRLYADIRSQYSMVQRLNECWEKYFAEHLSQLHTNVWTLVTASLTLAARLYQDRRTNVSGIDRVTFYRRYIDKQERSYPYFLELLVDMGIAVLKWYAKKLPEQLQALLYLWSQTDVPALQRMSLYGSSLLKNSQQELMFFKESPLLSADYIHPDVFCAAKRLFGVVTESERVWMVDFFMKLAEKKADRGGRILQVHDLFLKFREIANLSVLTQNISWLHERLPKDEDREQVFIFPENWRVEDFAILMQAYVKRSLFVQNESAEQFFQSALEQAQNDKDRAIYFLGKVVKYDAKASGMGSEILQILGQSEQSDAVVKQVSDILMANEHINVYGCMLCDFLVRQAEARKGYAVFRLKEWRSIMDATIDWCTSYQKTDAINHPISRMIYVLICSLDQDIELDGGDIQYAQSFLERILVIDTLRCTVLWNIGRYLHILRKRIPEFVETEIQKRVWKKNHQDETIGFFNGFFCPYAAIHRSDFSLVKSKFDKTIDLLPKLDHDVQSEYGTFLASFSLNGFFLEPRAGERMTATLRKILLKMPPDIWVQYFSHLANYFANTTEYIWESRIKKLIEFILDCRKRVKRGLSFLEWRELHRIVLQSGTYLDFVVDKIIKLSYGDKTWEFYDTLNVREFIDQCQNIQSFVRYWLWVGENISIADQDNRAYRQILRYLIESDKVIDADKHQLRERMALLGGDS